MPTQSQKLLQITSIIMIVGAAISVVLNLIALLGAAVLITIGAATALIYVGLILSIAGTVFQFIAGIQGVKTT